MKRLQRGFSLIELMIVIAIIGILAAIAIPSYQTYVLKSKLGELLSASSAAQLAAAEYVQSSGSSTGCAGMPIVVTNAGASQVWFGGTNVGAFSYPTSNLVASVSIDDGCNIEVQGQANQWGANEGTTGQPVVIGTANVDSTGNTSWTCNVVTTLGQIVPYAPSTCAATN